MSRRRPHDPETGGKEADASRPTRSEAKPSEGRQPERERSARAKARQSFADALRGVRPLEGRDRLRPPPQPPEPAPSRAAAREPRRFAVEGSGEEIAGRAEDVSRAILAKLRRGEPAPESEVDLHGLAARDARRQLEHALREAQRAGRRCVLAIHGRGLHSKSHAVLRGSLPEWLQAAPQSELVMAFASAPRALGGPGATLVLIRRVRERAVSSAAPRRSGEPDEI